MKHISVPIKQLLINIAKDSEFKLKVLLKNKIINAEELNQLSKGVPNAL